MNYICHVPLAGGFALGNMNVMGKPPLMITSFTPFESNDLLLRRYLEKKGYTIPYFQLDKLNGKLNELAEIASRGIDFCSGIPPCSGLSMASQLKPGARATSPVNDWMYESANFILEHIKPKVYCFENAPALFTGAGEEVRKKIIGIGEKNGYSITFYKTNTLKHGIPQFRPRTFGLFLKGPNAPILNYYNRKSPHIIDYLKQIPANASLQKEYACSEWDITQFEIYKYLRKLYGENWRKVMTDYKPHSTTYEYLQRINMLDDFQNWQKTLPDASEIVTKNIEHIKKKSAMGKGARINYRVLEIDKEYTYAVIGEMMGKQVHPIEDRLLNIREFCHLMGLPHDYDLEPKEYVKISQNVPVATCTDMTTEIVEIIKGNRTLSSKSVYMQDNTKEYENKKTKSLF